MCQSSCSLTLQHILKALYFNSYQLSLLPAVYNFYPPCSISVVCTFDSTSTQSSKCQWLCSDCLPNCGHMFPIPNSSYQISIVAMKHWNPTVYKSLYRDFLQRKLSVVIVELRSVAHHYFHFSMLFASHFRFHARCFQLFPLCNDDNLRAEFGSLALCNCRLPNFWQQKPAHSAADHSQGQVGAASSAVRGDCRQSACSCSGRQQADFLTHRQSYGRISTRYPLPVHLVSRLANLKILSQVCKKKVIWK